MVIRDRSRPSGIICGTRLNECKDFPGLWAATGTITLTASHPLLGQAEVRVRSAAVTNTSELG
jgi:hypothetical protein